MAMGTDFVDPRETRGKQGANSGGKFVSDKRPPQMDVPKNVWSIPYLLMRMMCPGLRSGGIELMDRGSSSWSLGHLEHGSSGGR